MSLVQAGRNNPPVKILPLLSAPMENFCRAGLGMSSNRQIPTGVDAETPHLKAEAYFWEDRILHNS
jgi:hypothetical protein